MGSHKSRFEVIEDRYAKGDRYLLGKNPDANGNCPAKYRRAHVTRKFKDGATADFMNYWSKKDAELNALCLPATDDPNSDWFDAEDLRDHKYKIMENNLDMTDEYYLPLYCDSWDWCFNGFLPNEKSIGAEHRGGFLESSGDCNTEGGMWVDNKAGQFKPKPEGGVCLFRKGTKPLFVQAAAFTSETTCTAAGYVWNNKWLNRLNHMSTPCQYERTHADDATYDGDDDAKTGDGISDKGIVILNDAPTHIEEGLTLMEMITKFILAHPYIVGSVVALYFLAPTLLTVEDILT